MPDTIRCPGCGHAYSVTEAVAGKRVRCRTCQMTFQIPARPESFTSLDDAADDWSQAELSATAVDPLRRSSTRAADRGFGSASLLPRAKQKHGTKSLKKNRGKQTAVTVEEFVAGFLCVNLIVFSLFLRSGRPIGPYTLGLNVVLALATMIVAFISTRHKSTRVLVGTFGATAVMVLIVGFQGIGLVMKGPFGNAGRQASTAPFSGRNGASAATLSEPAPSGHPITIWNAKLKKEKGGFNTNAIFSMDYRLDQEISDTTESFVWVVEDGRGGRVEFPISGSDFKRRGTLVGKGIAVDTYFRQMVAGHQGRLPENWRTYIEQGRVSFKRKLVSNSVAVTDPSRPSGTASSRSTTGTSAPDMTQIRRRMQERVDALIKSHGPDKVVTLYGDDFTVASWSFIEKKVRSTFPDATCVRGPGSSHRLVFVVAPFADVNAFASQIDFADVQSVDVAGRAVTMRANASKLPEDMRPIPSNPRDPTFYSGNLAALRSSVNGRQAEALRNLKKAPPKELRDEITEAIKPLLLDKSVSVRQDALEAYVVWSESDVVPELIRALDDSSTTVRNVALDKLAETKDPRAVEPVVALLKTDPYAVERRIKLLGSVASKAVAEHLLDTDKNVQQTALRILKDIGVPKEATTSLVGLLESPEFSLRAAALAALGTTTEPVAVEAIAKLLLDTLTCTNAVRTLKKIGEPAEESVDIYLQHEDPVIRGRAMDVLAEIATKKSVPVLLVALKDDNITVRNKALAKLVQLKAPEAIEPIAQMLMTSSTRYAGIQALKDFGSSAEDVVLKGLELPNRDVVRDCLGILQTIGTQKSAKAITQLSRSKDTLVRVAAQSAGRAIMARGGQAVTGKQ